MSHLSQFTAVAKTLFFSKNNPDDIRLGDLFKPAEAETLEALPTPTYALLGYPDDEGIHLNGGRPGARLAPSQIREFLYKMTPNTDLKKLNRDAGYYDVGDLTITDDLATRHARAQNTVLSLQKKGIRSISLGGGHDYGYPDASAFIKAHLNSAHMPVVLNFDAHLDVRPVDKGLNSGTPFFRLLSEFEGRFKFAEIGIQPQCNSVRHREWALSKGAQIFDLKNLQLKSLLQHPFFSQLTPQTPVFISFDIDCITSSEGGGCSQAWPTGLTTAAYLDFFAELALKSDVRGLGIYEVSPPLDTDNRTSRLAALLIYNYIFQEYL